MDSTKLRDTTKTNADSQEHNKALARGLSGAVDAVLVSRDARLVDDAPGVLVSRIGEASGLLASSDGRVDDDQVRVNLSSALDGASKVRDDAKVGVKYLKDTDQELSDAMGKVSGAMQARTDSEAQEAGSGCPAGSVSDGGTPWFLRGRIRGI